MADPAGTSGKSIVDAQVDHARGERRAIAWSEVRDDLRADRAHWRRRGHARVRPRKGYHAIWLYRMSRQAHDRGWKVFAWLLWILNSWWTGADIPPKSCIAGGFYLPHPYGAIVAGRVGRGASFAVQASIGGLLKEPDGDIGGGPGLPVLGDGVSLNAGALVLGLVHIGDGATLGPRTVILKDIPAGEEVMPAPWRSVPLRGRPS